MALKWCAVLRQRQASTAQIPVIFVTGLTDDEARIKGMALGAVDFVSKTSDPKALARSGAQLHRLC
jgi:DNA-binding response OmpR family regulator